MYWTFVGLSCLFILPSTFLVVRTMFREESSQERDNSLEINFLKSQLLQINSDIANGIAGRDEKLKQISISRKIVSLQNNVTDKEKLMNSPTKITVWVSIFIFITCFVGTHLIYLLTNNDFFTSQDVVTLGGKGIALEQRNLSQEKIEKTINKERTVSRSDLTSLQYDNLEKLVNELKVVLSNRPNDLRGQKLLVKNSARLGDFITSRKAQKKVLNLLKEKANSTDYAQYAELCVIAASGYVSSEAATAIDKAILLDPNNSAANFYLSLLLLQQNKRINALKIWVQLLKTEPSSSKWIMMLIPQIKHISSDLKIELTTSDGSDPTHLSPRLIFLQVVETMEKRLNQYNGPIEHWISLVQIYQNLMLPQKAKIIIEKIKSQFLLSNSQIEELKNNLELK